jgi:hypothetical protein
MGWLLALPMQLPSVERMEKLIRKGPNSSRVPWYSFLVCAFVRTIDCDHQIVIIES